MNCKGFPLSSFWAYVALVNVCAFIYDEIKWHRQWPGVGRCSKPLGNKIPTPTPDICIPVNASCRCMSWDRVKCTHLILMFTLLAEIPLNKWAAYFFSVIFSLSCLDPTNSPALTWTHQYFMPWSERPTTKTVLSNLLRLKDLNCFQVVRTFCQLFFLIMPFSNPGIRDGSRS